MKRYRIEIPLSTNLSDVELLEVAHLATLNICNSIELRGDEAVPDENEICVITDYEEEDEEEEKVMPLTQDAIKNQMRYIGRPKKYSDDTWYHIPLKGETRLYTEMFGRRCDSNNQDEHLLEGIKLSVETLEKIGFDKNTKIVAAHDEAGHWSVELLGDLSEYNLPQYWRLREPEELVNWEMIYVDPKELRGVPTSLDCFDEPYVIVYYVRD